MEEYSRNLKRVATVIVMGSSFCYMLMFTSFGTTLIDFKEITNTTLDKMSFSLSFRFAGCCIGALLNFSIPKKLNMSVLYSFVLITLGALTLILGQLTKLWSVFFVEFLMGVASGAVEVICVAQIYQLWSDKGGPFMQATMFGWNLAGICSPLLFEPFLSPTKTNELPNSNFTFTERQNSSALTNVSETFNVTLSAKQSINETNTNLSSIWIPYSIIGVLLIISGFVVITIPVYMFSRSKQFDITTASEIDGEMTKSNEPKPEKENNDKQVKTSHWKRYRIYLLTLCTSLLFIYFIIFDVVMQFWLIFVVNCDLKLTKSKAAFMISALNVAYAVSSLAGVFITTKVKPFKLIFTLLLMITAANVIHLFFANTSLPMLWIGALLQFAGFGCFYAAVLNYMQIKVGLTTRMCSVLVAWGFVPSAVSYTAIIANYIETMPLILVYNNIGCVIIIALLLFAIYKLDTINKRKNEEHEINFSLKKPEVNANIIED